MIVNKIEDNHITGFKFNDNIIASKSVVGTFVKNTAELSIINLNHIYDNLKGEYIDIARYGSWYVNDLETDEEFTESTLQLNDITQKFDETYDDTFSFPNSMKNWAIWIGEKVGVPFKGDFLKSDLVLVEKPYLGNNPKYRDAVKFIAKITGNYAQKNYDNTYSIKWFEDKAIDIENWESFVHGNATKPINVIVLSTGDTEDNVKWPKIEPENPHELRIEDDWINIDRYELHEAIYNQVNGFFYVPISKLEVPFGLLELRAGQKIKTKDIELQDIETYISSITLEWQGGDFNNPSAWTSSVKMEELNETSTNLKYANSVLNRVLAVERKTDKNAGLIEDTIKSTNGTKKELTSMKLEVGKISLKVETLEDDKAVTGASIIAKINNDESEITINGDKLKLEGYTTINEGFGVDLEGNAFMNGASINGGNIELVDTGEDSEPTFRIYDKSKVEEISRVIRVGDNLGGKTLELSFPNGFYGSGTITGDYESFVECEYGAIKYKLNPNNYAIDIRYELYNSSGETIEIKYLYEAFPEIDSWYISINLKEIFIPNSFGKITNIKENYVNESNGNEPLYQYIKISEKNIKYKTDFKSSGLSIVDENVQSYYQSDGVRISDERGERAFDINGINWSTPYGIDFANFVMNKDLLLFSKSSQFLIDFTNSDSSNHELTFNVGGNLSFKANKQGIYTNDITLVNGDYVVKGGNVKLLNMISTPYLEIRCDPVNNVSAYGVNVWASDKRLKKDIEDSNYNALDLINKIKHRKFKYKNNDKEIAIGYVADELEELDEDLIFKVGEEKIKQPCENYIIPILSKAIQEQQKQIEELKQEINKLKEE